MKGVLLLSLCLTLSYSGDKVPNEMAAIKIAEVEWLKIYGDKIYQKTPFCAKLENDSIWHVYGTLRLSLGGVPHAYINNRTSEIIKVTHGK